jgi:hypothetical protein
MPIFTCLIYGRDDKVMKLETIDHLDSAAVEQQARNLMGEAGEQARGYGIWSDGKRIAWHFRKQALQSA